MIKELRLHLFHPARIILIKRISMRNGKISMIQNSKKMLRVFEEIQSRLNLMDTTMIINWLPLLKIKLLFTQVSIPKTETIQIPLRASLTILTYFCSNSTIRYPFISNNRWDLSPLFILVQILIASINNT